MVETHGTAEAKRSPAVFLDRDGVVNVDTGYVHSPEEFEFVRGAPEAIRRLNEAGYLVVVVTNQSGIGRGTFTEDDFDALTSWIDGRLAAAGARIDATYHCPHHPTEGRGEHRVECECRKPAPGMFLRAIREMGIDPSASLAIGDKPRDAEAAEAAGVAALTFDGADLLSFVERNVPGMSPDDGDTTPEKPRIAQIDALRAFAMLCVILSHTVHPADFTGQSLNDHVMRGLEATLSSFQLPLFFAIAGFLAYPRAGEEPLAWLKRKAWLLAVPYAAWASIAYAAGWTGGAARAGFLAYAVSVVLRPGPLWQFLYALMLGFALLAPAAWLARRFGPWVHALMPALLVAAWAAGATLLGLDTQWWYSLWIAAGYVAATYWASWKGIGRYTRVAGPVVFVGLLLAQGAVPPGAPTWARYVLAAVTTASGIATADAVCALLGRTPVRAWLARMGRITLPVFIGQQVFYAAWAQLGLAFPRAAWQTLPLAAVALAFALAVYLALGHIPVVGDVLLGGRRGSG